MKKKTTILIIAVALIALLAIVPTASALVQPGSIYVSSTPSNANVSLYYSSDYYGTSSSYKLVDTGTTPCTFKNLSAENYESYKVVVSKTGYYSSTYYVYGTDIDGGNTKYISADLQLIPEVANGYISVSSSPSDAKIYVDGDYEGTTPKTVTVDGNITHTVKLVKSGYVSQSKSVYVSAGETTSVSMTLESSTTYGYLEVSSSPSEANIYIDGVSKGKTPMTITLTTGNHTLELSKSGYTGFTKTVTVYEGATSSVYSELAENPTSAYVNISSTPKGASVYIDGEYVGTTPTVQTVSAGIHTVKLSNSGYNDSINTINVSAGQSYPLQVTLTPTTTTGTLSVSSSPSGATVYVDGTSKGTTPTSISLSSGSHTIKLEKSGYETYTTTTTITSGKTTTLSPALTPVSTAGTLSVSSSPSGATVYVDGTSKGTTPTSVSLGSGSHTIKLEKSGYETYTTTTTITSGKTTTLSPTLTPVTTTGTLSVSSSPSGATVYVDGIGRGTTPTSISLSSGSHTIKLEKSGYSTYTTTTTITAGKTTTLSPALPLISTTGTLSVSSSPDGATVYVDGVKKGVTPNSFTLNAGNHQILITKEGYENWEYQEAISINNVSFVNATLNKSSDEIILSPPVIIIIIAILVAGIVIVVVAVTRSSRKKHVDKSTSISHNNKMFSTQEETVTRNENKTNNTSSTTVTNETKTDVKGGDTIITINTENYVAGNVGTIAKDDAVVNRSGVDVFEQVKKCPYCGSDISSDSVFCGKCGKKLK